MSLSEMLETPSGRIQLLTSDIWTESRRSKGGGILDYSQEIIFLRNWLGDKHRPVFLDIGANVGIFTFHLQDLCSEVHAWEPQRVICDLLKSTISLNKWSHVYAYWGALGFTDGAIDMPTLDYSIPSNFGGLELKSLRNPEIVQTPMPWDGESVELRTLDSYQFSGVDMMKIDVEGMEMEVLSGAEETIKKFRPGIFIEFPKCGYLPVVKWMKAHNYRYFQMDGNLACEPIR